MDPCHTTFEMIAPLTTDNLVPPHASTNELNDGKSACTLPSFSLSLEPWSPADAQTVTPSKTAALNFIKIGERLLCPCSTDPFALSSG